MGDRDDATLVSLAQAGDPAALDDLLRRHYDRILGICRRLAGNEADALDATQEALIAIARGIRRFDGRAAFTTWAYRVTTNACLDELRRRRRRPQLGLPDELGASEGAATTELVPEIEGLGERLAIDSALAQLAPEFRAAVVLRDLCDLDYAEISDVLGIPPGTVRSRIARGRRQLAALLPAAGNQEDRPGRPTKRSRTRPPAGSQP